MANNNLTSFRTPDGRRWDLALDAAGVERIKHETGFDVDGLGHGRLLSAAEFQTLGDFLRDSPRFLGAITALLEPVWRAAGLSPEAFAGQIVSSEGVVLAAWFALQHAIEGYLPEDSGVRVVLVEARRLDRESESKNLRRNKNA